MRIGETTVASTPEMTAVAEASIAHARSIPAAELHRRIAAVNAQPLKVAALYRRLAQYRRNRLAAEAAI